MTYQTNNTQTRRRRFLCFFLALLMLLPMIAACDNANAPEEESTVKETENTDETVEITRENTPDGLPDTLNFGGDSVKILYAQVDANFDRKTLEIEGDMSINKLSKSVWQRNAAVEERLNIKFDFQIHSATVQTAYTSALDTILFQSGDTSIDIIYHLGAEAVVDGNMGYLKNINELPYIDLEQPWWFKDQIENVSLNKTGMFILMGDICPSEYSNMTAVFYNKELFRNIYSGQNKTCDDLYDMVEAGTWTWEQYFQLVAGAYIDSNGDTVKNAGDVFGAHTEAGNRTATYYPYASGLHLTVRDEDGYPKFNYNNEKTIDMAEDLYDFVYENAGTFQMNYDEAEAAFFGNQLLFYAYFLSRGFSIINSDVEYGILPFPKYDESVDYITPVLVGASVITIPNFLSDERLEIVGATLEAMCAESYRSVILNYYDSILKGRFSTAQRDADMIDVIRDHVGTDFTFWNSSSVGDADKFFRDLIITKKSKDFVSLWSQRTLMYQGSLSSLITSYKKKFA